MGTINERRFVALPAAVPVRRDEQAIADIDHLLGFERSVIRDVETGLPAGRGGLVGHREAPRGDHRGGARIRPRAAVAQLARASACHAEGRGFESHQPLQAPLSGGAFSSLRLLCPAPWRSGYAAACKAVYTGSIPVGASHKTPPPSRVSPFLGGDRGPHPPATCSAAATAAPPPLRGGGLFSPPPAASRLRALPLPLGRSVPAPPFLLPPWRGPPFPRVCSSAPPPPFPFFFVRPGLFLFFFFCCCFVWMPIALPRRIGIATTLPSSARFKKGGNGQRSKRPRDAE